MPTNSGDVYFIATSVGLFSTEALSGSGTAWVQEGTEVIGNVVVSMITARPEDSFLAAGNHGRGVYSAKLKNSQQYVNDQKPGSPHLIELLNNYPNPFKSETVISYGVYEHSKVALSIVDMNGRTVRIFNFGKKMPGSYSVRWNGEDDNGRQVASGIYLLNCKKVKRCL